MCDSKRDQVLGRWHALVVDDRAANASKYASKPAGVTITSARGLAADRPA